MTAGIVGAIALAVALAAVVVIYNRLVALRNHVSNAYSQIEVQLKRRHDLIPNLVAAVKGYMEHERETLQAVTEARSRAMEASRHAGAAPGQTALLGELASAESALSGALSHFFAVVENYPDLKASQNMALLQEDLTSTENKVAFARQAFNDAVMRYNSVRQTFPTVLIAPVFGFGDAAFLEFEDTGQYTAPKVQL